MVKFFGKFSLALKEYCLNSSLAGLRYVANDRYHYSERLFWLFCIIASWIGSTFLIINYIDSYFNNSASMGVVSLHPTDKISFPSAGICEMGYAKQEYKDLEKVIDEMAEDSMDIDEKRDMLNDIEDYLLRIVFHNLYTYGSLTTYCSPYLDCEDCLKCPMKGFQKFANRVRSSCPKLFSRCEWNEKEFDCCNYFQPVRTTLGTCYLINSVQVTDKNSKHWLDMSVGMREGNGHLNITVTKPSAVYILNEEDIPHMLLTTLHFPQTPDGYYGEILLSIQDVINDPYLRNIDPINRKCVFPDEQFDSAYSKYSYSTCVTDCLKNAQIKVCNCTHYNLIVHDNDKSPECDYFGMDCLDKSGLLFPKTTIMQPWRPDGLSCICLPSCNEKQINVVGRSSKIRGWTSDRSVSIRLQSLPAQRYFRQAVREKIDIVVSVGGILGLFMGASIMSFFELVYFFTIRTFRQQIHDRVE